MVNDDRPDVVPTAPAAGQPIPYPAAVTLARCLAVMSAVAGVIHFAVADMHYQEYWAFGVFMVATGLLQMAWVAAALFDARRWVWAAGIVVNGGIVAVYIVTRTVGDVVGPTPHDVEPVGFGDLFCTLLEAGLVVGCLVLLSGWTGRRIPRQRAGLLTGATGVVAATLLVVALLDGGSEMTMSDDMDASAAVTSVAPAAHHTMTMPMGSAHVAALHLRTNSPAGSIVASTHMTGMGAGMKMVSAPCTATPTAAQQAATVSLVDRSWAAAQKYRSLAAAKAAGFVPLTPSGLAVVHYVNVRYYENVLSGGSPLNPSEPQSLVYANTPKGAVLAATMYLSAPGTTQPPQPGGCLDQWHIHTNLCFGGFGTVVGLTHSGSCAAGSTHHVTQPMLHIWYVPIPGGPTAVDAPDRQVVRAAEKVSSPHNPMA